MEGQWLWVIGHAQKYSTIRGFQTLTIRVKILVLRHIETHGSYCSICSYLFMMIHHFKKSQKITDAFVLWQWSKFQHASSRAVTHVPSHHPYLSPNWHRPCHEWWLKSPIRNWTSHIPPGLSRNGRTKSAISSKSFNRENAETAGCGDTLFLDKTW